MTVFLMYLPEIIGNTLFFMMAHEPYNNQIVSFPIFFEVFSKHFTQTVAMMTGDSPSNITDLAKTSAIVPFVKCLFIFRICIVVMNTLIGLTVSKIEYILKKADLIRIEKTAHACQLMPIFLSKRTNNNRKWTKIRFVSNGDSSIWNLIWNFLVDAQIEDVGNLSAFIRAEILDEKNEMIFSCDLPSWIGINARNILKERARKTLKIKIANQQHEDIKQICCKMAEEQQNMMIKILAQEKTIHDKLQANSDVQNRYLPDFEKVNTSLVQKTVVLNENLEEAKNEIAQLKERLQKYERVY